MMYPERSDRYLRLDVRQVATQLRQEYGLEALSIATKRAVGLYVLRDVEGYWLWRMIAVSIAETENSA